MNVNIEILNTGRCPLSHVSHVMVGCWLDPEFVFILVGLFGHYHSFTQHSDCFWQKCNYISVASFISRLPVTRCNPQYLCCLGQ